MINSVISLRISNVNLFNDRVNVILSLVEYLIQSLENEIANVN